MTPFDPIMNQLVEAMEAAGIPKGIGGFDITMNEHQRGKFEPHWQPHAWILVPKGRSDAEIIPSGSISRRQSLLCGNRS